MSDTSRKPPAPTSKAVAPATTAPRASAAPAAKTDKAKPRPAMRSDERLIGRSIIGSGSPHKN
jgi:hypothetical protein